MITDPGMFARMHAARAGELDRLAERRRRRQEAIAPRSPWLAAVPALTRRALVGLVDRARAGVRRQPARVTDCTVARSCCQASV